MFFRKLNKSIFFIEIDAFMKVLNCVRLFVSFYAVVFHGKMKNIFCVEYSMVVEIFIAREISDELSSRQKHSVFLQFYQTAISEMILSSYVVSKMNEVVAKLKP